MKFLRFVRDYIVYALSGGRGYYTWLAILVFVFIPFAYGAYEQWLVQGMKVLGLTDQVSWGPYMGNVAFLVGVAAAAVTVVFPYYIYHYKPLKNVVLIGEMMAISAVSMVIMLVLFHMGRPDRLWHIIPGLGIFNWPNSMLNWDVLVLNGYLFLNILTGFYYMYKKYTHQPINETFYKVFIYISCVWALSIHTVTAFLLNTMPTRPIWYTAIMPIKFISTAFAGGTAIILFVVTIVRKYTRLEIPDKAIDLISQITAWTLGISLFLIMSEIVTELYPSTEHANQLKYLIHGLYGGEISMLSPWIWTSWILMVGSFILLLFPKVRLNFNILPIIALAIFAGIWIDKGIGLVIPGQVISPIGEVSEFHPTVFDVVNNLGVWAVGMFLFTLLAKGAIGVMLGEVSYAEVPAEEWTFGRLIRSAWEAKGALAAVGVVYVVLGGLAIYWMSTSNGTAQASVAKVEKKAPVTNCFESREGYTTIKRVENAVPEYGWPNVKCSETTGAVLWWGDPFTDTIPMGEMPVLGEKDPTRGSYEFEEAVVRPRTPHLRYYNFSRDKHCTMCHNGKVVPFPKDKKPRLLKAHQDIVPNSLQLQHGRGAIWCLDCHNPTNRNTLIGHNGEEISFNQPQKLCGKCHGQIYADWRMGIHGKRIGMWVKGGKKRWWVCTECHNPHTVQVKRFQPLRPEPAPHLPKGTLSADYEKEHLILPKFIREAEHSRKETSREAKKEEH